LRDARRAHDSDVRDSHEEQDKSGIRLPVDVHGVAGMCTLTRRVCGLPPRAAAVMTTSSMMLALPSPAAAVGADLPGPVEVGSVGAGQGVDQSELPEQRPAQSRLGSAGKVARRDLHGRGEGGQGVTKGRLGGACAGSSQTRLARPRRSRGCRRCGR
jgi:hypothetical protein